MTQPYDERRGDLRYNHPGMLTVAHLESGLLVHALIRDLSLGGCGVELSEDAQFVDGMVVELVFNTANLEFRALGTIRHADRANRTLGIAFMILSRRGLIDMETLMIELDKHRAQAAGHLTAEQFA